MEVVFQSTDKLPEGRKPNPERQKPWGTNHAVLMGKDVIKEPFGVINADDYYGAESFQVLGDFLRSVEGKKNAYCMVGFNIENTLSENGGVSRGLCEVDQNSFLTGVNIRAEREKRLHRARGRQADSGRTRRLEVPVPRGRKRIDEHVGFHSRLFRL